MEGKKVNSLTYYYKKFSESSEGSKEQIRAFNMLNGFCLALIEETTDVQEIQTILGFCPPGSSSEKLCLDKTTGFNPNYSEDDGDYDSLSAFIDRSVSAN